MAKVLIIGAGGVGTATAHKCAQHNDEFGEICFASRTVEKCERIIEDIRRMGNFRDPDAKFYARALDGSNKDNVVALIEDCRADIVINVPVTPDCKDDPGKEKPPPDEAGEGSREIIPR